MMVDMKVSGLTIDPLTNMPILVLKDKEGKHAVPIWIGLIEASAIATELESLRRARTMTHDMKHNMLGQVGVRVERVEVNDLRDNTFYASIFLARADGSVTEIDSRPSDAVALALRAAAPIRVAKKVIERARKIDLRDAARDQRTADPLRAAAVAGARSSSRGKDGAVGRRPPKPAPDLKDPVPEEHYRELLENLPDEEFGKWKM